MSKCGNRLVLLLDQYTGYRYFNNYELLYPNVAYDLLPYNMNSVTLTVEINSK